MWLEIGSNLLHNLNQHPAPPKSERKKQDPLVYVFIFMQVSFRKWRVPELQQQE